MTTASHLLARGTPDSCAFPATVAYLPGRPYSAGMPAELPPAEIAGSDERMQELAEWLAARVRGATLATGWAAGHSRKDGALHAGLAVVYTPRADGRPVVAALVLLGQGITAEDLRRVPIMELENSAALTHEKGHREALAELPPLRRSPDVPAEDFASRVAEHYRQWAALVPNPVAAMADEWQVKRPTMHGWVREARLRGFLPEARRGKRGGENSG